MTTEKAEKMFQEKAKKYVERELEEVTYHKHAKNFIYVCWV